MRWASTLCFAALASSQPMAAALEGATDPRACACTGMDCRTGGKAHDERSSLEIPTNPEMDDNLQFTSLLQTGIQLGGTRDGHNISGAQQRTHKGADCPADMKPPSGEWGQLTDLYSAKSFVDSLQHDRIFAEGLDKSQCHQSSILHRAFFGLGDVPIKRGTVLEIGAGDGIRGSNSHAFEVGLGWRTILIEANPDSARALKQSRPGAEVHAPVVISTSSGHVDYAMCEDADRSHIATDEEGKKCISNIGVETTSQIVQIPSAPLSTFLKDTPELDILFLDVEGAELMVLETIDFNNTKIHVVNVENGCPGSAVGDFLESKGFVPRGNIMIDFVWTWGAAPSPAQERSVARLALESLG